ncbi:MAG: LysR family transcriptional regulator [Mesosutterella sp.]|nr:LysR family transcriptional regulator [Mesosutterella sp.]
MNALENVGYWRLFLALSRSGSLSAAARSEGCSLAAASRTLARLERELGFLVLERSRRPAALTARAKALVPAAENFVRAAQAVAAASASGSGAGRTAGALRGHFRISLPANSGRSTYFALLQELESRHPGFSAEIMTDCGTEGLLAGQADLALMPCEPASKQLAFFPAGLEYTFLMATPGYLRQHGRPESIGQLENYTVLLQSAASAGFSTRLERGSQYVYLSPSQPCRQGDPLFCSALLLQGEGIAVDVALGAVEDELAYGRVVPVLDGWHREPWRNAVVCRAVDAGRPAFSELARILRDHAVKTAEERWKRWYAHFGFMSAVSQAEQAETAGPRV